MRLAVSPLRSRVDDDPGNGVAFDLLRPLPDGPPVMTGHADGIITLNVEEADDAKRESLRAAMQEPYRTLIGHLRHELGHYYWMRLVGDRAWHEPFKAVFGDDGVDYSAALKRHYESGPPPDWRLRHVSAYASAHPWEDWAETWAHYLHMVDTLETAKSHGLTVRAPATERAGERIATDRLPLFDFDALSIGWNAVTLMLNSLNRSMGMKDAYPFVLTAPVLDKLRFVHKLVQAPVLSEVNAAA
jgi:hypothetical protein